MRIAYIGTGVNVSERYGIANKLARQAAAWRAAGHDTALFIQSHRLPDDHGRGIFARSEASFFASGSLRGRSMVAGLQERARTLAALADSVAAWEPDLLYIRYNVWYPALETLAKRFPTVLEINTDDLSEYRLVQSRMGYAYHRATRARLLRRARGMVFVSGELAESPSYRVFGKPSLVIGNGVELGSFSPVPGGDPARCPRLVFLGSPGHPWHGVDKIIQLARLQLAWDFDIIGTGPEDLSTPAPDNIRLHGYLSRAEYERVLAGADAAIGSLALHRNGMDEASPLKVREYLAFGLPVIIGFRDTDLSDEAPYVLRIPNTEDSVVVALDEIRSFVDRVRGMRVPRTEIAHLDTGVKEAARLRFFEALTGPAADAQRAG